MKAWIFISSLYLDHSKLKYSNFISLATYRDLIPVDPLSCSHRSLWCKIPLCICNIGTLASNWITSAYWIEEHVYWTCLHLWTLYFSCPSSVSKQLWRYSNKLWCKLVKHWNTVILWNLETWWLSIVAPEQSKATTTGPEGL